MILTQQMYVGCCKRSALGNSNIGQLWREIEGRDMYISNEGRYLPWESIEHDLQRRYLRPFNPETDEHLLNNQ